MSDLRTATNPETGEKVIEIDGEWTPEANVPTATNPETGERVAQVGGQWVPFPQSNIIPTEQAGTAGERARAGIKLTPEGKLGFVESVVGEDNAIMTPGGEIMFRRAKNETWRPFDENSASFKDILDITGPAMEALPGVATALAAQTPAGRGAGLLRTMAVAGAADAAGNVARQGISAALPGSDGLSVVDRAADTLMAGAIGAAGQGVAEGIAGPFVERINPKNAFISRPLQGVQDTAHARIGRNLARRGNSHLTLGEETGDKGLLFAEGLARRHIATAARIERMEQRRLAAQVARLKQITARLGNLSGKENAGHAIRSTYEQARDAAINVRRHQAGVDFAVVDRASGGSPVVPIDNFVTELDALIQQRQIIGRSKELGELQSFRRSITQQAEEVAEDGVPDAASQVIVFGDGTLASGRVVQNTLSELTKAANGTGQIFKDLGSASERGIARRLRQALERDLDDAAAREGLPAEIAEGLQRARNNYRTNSAQIEEIAQGSLGRLLESRSGQALDPTVVADKLGKMPIGDFRQAVNLLAETDEEAFNSIKRAYMENILEQSKHKGGRVNPTDTDQFSMTNFSRQMRNPDTARRMRTIMSRTEFLEVKRVSSLLERFNFKHLEGSPTAPIQMAMDFLRSSGAILADPIGTLKVAGEVLSMRQIMRAIEDPQARAALLEISRASEPTKRAAQAAATFAAIMLTEAEGEKDEQQAATRPQATNLSVLGSF